MSGTTTLLPPARENIVAGTTTTTTAAVCYAFNTLAELTAFNPTTASMVDSALVSGASAAGDGHGGLFYWQPQSTATADGVNVIAPTGLTLGRWTRFDIILDNVSSISLTTTGGTVTFGSVTTSATYVMGISGPDLQLVNAGGAGGTLQLGGVGLTSSGALNVGGQSNLSTTHVAGNATVTGAVIAASVQVAGTITAASFAGSLAGTAATATALATPRTLALSGDATASGVFDGSANLTLSVALATQGQLTAGVFAGVTFNARGVATAARALVAADITSALGYTAYSTGNPAGYVNAAGAAAAAPIQTVANQTGPNVVLHAADITDLASVVTGPLATAAVSGDLAGNLPSPTVARIGGVPISLQTPAAGDRLVFDGTRFTNQAQPLVNSNVGSFGVLTVNALGQVIAARAMSGVDVSGALAFTPYNAANPAGFIAASALTPYATLASPVFSGAPQAPTPLAADNSAALATTAFVKNQLYATTSLIPTKLSQLVNDSAYVTSAAAAAAAPVQSVAGRVGIVALTVADIAGAAPLASPALTGNPTAPTPANGNNSTSLATTAFVASAGFLTGNQTITASGDVAGSGTTTLALALKSTGIPGTYSAVTTDAQGRVVSGSSPTTLAGAGILNAVVNAGGLISVQSGLAAARPAAGTAGRLYVSSDSGAAFLDTGSVWVAVQAGLTGDASNVGTALTLATVNSNPGVYAGLTVNAKGLIVAARALSNTDVATALGFTPYSAANPNGFIIASALTPYAVLASPALSGVPTAPTALATDASTTLATTAFVKNQSYLTGNQTVTLGGDATGSGATGITVVLKSVGIAGTYSLLTTDPQGRVISGSSPTTMSGLGITNGVVNGGGLPAIISGALAALPTPGLLGRLFVATDTGGLYSDTGSAWTPLRPAITGDIVVASGSGAASLALVNSTPGSYANLNINAKGLVTAVRAPNNADIVAALGYTPYNASNPAGYTATTGLSGYALTASPQLTGVPTAPTALSSDASTTLATTAFVKNQSYLSANQVITASGDATGAGSTSLVLALKATGTAGSYFGVTTDAQGRVIAGSNPTTLAGFGIVNGVIAGSGAVSLAAALATNRPAAGTPGRFFAATDTGALFYDTGSAWTTLQAPLTGDLATIGAVATLATVNTSVGSFSNLTVNAKGLVTAVRAIASADVVAALGFTPYSAANPNGFIIASALTPYAVLASPALSGVPTAPTPLASDNSLTLATTAFVKNQSYLTANQSIAVSGDVAGNGTTALSLTLKATGTAGSYFGVTTDAQGRVIAGTKPTTLGGFGITDAIQGGAGASALAAGAIAARPPASMVGRIFVATDIGAIYADSGSAWSLIAPGATGDVIIAAGTGIATLATVLSNPGSYANLTVNGKGLVTAARAPNNADIVAALGFTPYNASNPAGYTATTGLSGYAPLTSPALAGNPTAPTPPASDNSTSIATTAFVRNQSYLAANQPITLTGDVTGTGNASFAATLRATGTAGSYALVTTDAQGRVVSGTRPTTLGGFGITDAINNAGGLPSIASGLAAARPAAGVAGRLFVATDTGAMSQDTGTAWITLQAVLSGDVSTAGTVATLASITAAGSYGYLTVNSKGLVTNSRALSNSDVVAALGYTPYNSSNPSGYTATAGLSGYALLASPVFSGNPTAPTPSSGDNSGSLATTSFVKNQSYLTANQVITASGDATGFGTTALALTLKATGTAGSYSLVTTDAQGRVITGSTPTTLAGLGVTNGIINGGGLGSITAGILAARPVAGSAGRLFVATDTGTSFYDSGTVWVALTVALSGDITTVAGASVATLATVLSTPGSFGGITVNGKGLVVAARAPNATDITNALSFIPAPLASPGLTGVPTAPTPLAADNSTTLATTAFIKNQGYLTANQGTTVTGDVTGIGGTNLTLTLVSAGTPGNYFGVTTDAKGRVIAGSNPTTLAGFGISNGVSNAGGVASLGSGTMASRPAAGIAGRTWLTTDTGAIWFDSGVVWILLEPAMTGDVTSPANSTVATLATVLSSPGTYANLTVNAKGLVTAARALAFTDITTALAYTPANLISPVFTGNPQAPTVGLTDATASIATTAWVKSLGYGTGSGAAYTLPVASGVVLGGVKIGANVAIAADGTITVPAGAFETAGAGAAAQAASVPRAGTTMTGPLLLSGDPSVGLGAATKQYVDAKAGSAAAGGSAGQVQANFSGALGGFTVGGDGVLNTGSGALTISKIGGVPISLGAAFTTLGANTLTFTTTGSTAVVLPTSGTLATVAGQTAALNTALPAGTTSQLYGGSGFAGSGVAITLGTNLSISNGVLNATGSGGGGSGPQATAPRVITTGTTATLAATDFLVLVNQTTAGPMTITMPTTPLAGYPYVVADYAGVAGVGSNAITLVGQTGATIKGDAVITSNLGAITSYWVPALNTWMVTA